MDPQRVTSDDLRRVLQKYLKHLVDPAQSLAVVVTAPTKAKVQRACSRVPRVLPWEDRMLMRSTPCPAQQLIVAGYRKLGYTVTEHVVTAHV